MCDYADQALHATAQWNATATDTGTETTEPQIVSGYDRTTNV